MPSLDLFLQVSVFSPSLRKHHFNITLSNIIQIYPTNSQEKTLQTPLVAMSTWKCTNSYFIKETLIKAIKLRCECHFPWENLLQESFSCSNLPHLTTYQNILIGTHNVNASQLVGFIQDWVNSGPKITIKSSYSVWVDKKYPAAVSSFDKPDLECQGEWDWLTKQLIQLAITACVVGFLWCRWWYNFC